ncbi:UNVERIFIED_CONTAM: G-box-binding factor 4 [Sesamum radiatum]|uniref:G-box-binding factor 4 n=1 Tax=Sesamum radiatum TaxID=300843 RepID=A0AAW2RYJ7_SESRA
MASSKVMASRSPPNPDHPRQPSSPSPFILHPDQTPGFGASMNMDDMLTNIDSHPDSFALHNAFMLPHAAAGEPAMTLEDFLAKAGAVTEDDVRLPQTGGYGLETTMLSAATAVPVVCVQNGVASGGFGVDFANGVVAVGGGAGRGKRRPAVEEVALDKVTQQKQRRMIKNRESAARSRERKQAYTLELESLVTHLEEENARLLEEEAELNKKRYKQVISPLEGLSLHFCLAVLYGKAPNLICYRFSSDTHGEPSSGSREAKTSKSFAENTFHGMVGDLSYTVDRVEENSSGPAVGLFSNIVRGRSNMDQSTIHLIVNYEK